MIEVFVDVDAIVDSDSWLEMGPPSLEDPLFAAFKLRRPETLSEVLILNSHKFWPIFTLFFVILYIENENINNSLLDTTDILQVYWQ